MKPNENKTELELNTGVYIDIDNLQLCLTQFTYTPSESGNRFKPPWPAELEVHEAYVYSEVDDDWTLIRSMSLDKLMSQTQIYTACINKVEKKIVEDIR